MKTLKKMIITIMILSGFCINVDRAITNIQQEKLQQEKLTGTNINMDRFMGHHPITQDIILSMELDPYYWNLYMWGTEEESEAALLKWIEIKDNYRSL